MATFGINSGLPGQATVEAEKYIEEGAFVTIFNADNERVASFATSRVATIRRVESK